MYEAAGMSRKIILAPLIMLIQNWSDQVWSVRVRMRVSDLVWWHLVPVRWVRLYDWCGLLWHLAADGSWLVWRHRRLVWCCSTVGLAAVISLWSRKGLWPEAVYPGSDYWKQICMQWVQNGSLFRACHVKCIYVCIFICSVVHAYYDALLSTSWFVSNNYFDLWFVNHFHLFSWFWYVI